MSVGIWAVTGSMYSLLFAALGPAVAVGSLLDGRRQRRGASRRDTDRTMVALGRARMRVLELQRKECARLQALAPALDEALLPSRVASNWAESAGESPAAELVPLPVRLGRSEGRGVVVIDAGASGHESDEELPVAVRSAIAGVRQAAASLPDAPWLVDARDGVGIVGPMPMAQALARSILLQLAAHCSPKSTRIVATSGEEWVRALPHSLTIEPAVSSDAVAASRYRLTGCGADLLIASAPDRSGLPPGARVIVELRPGAADESSPHPSFELAGIVRATAAAERLAALAAERGLLAAQQQLPEAVRLAEVLASATHHVRDGDGRGAATAGLRAPLGRDAAGIVEVDLVRDGPHAVVAGTTGAGKSELLVSWVLAMAARHPPSAVTFLLVDFKGGAAFAPLAGLAHVIGTVSDLDARRSARAIESLRAELLRRERLLAERGVRSIDEWEARTAIVGEAAARRETAGEGAAPAGLARLVIVVDEFAAVVSGQPELHELFADLSARGRSLGLHLILCTQRPSGVVRDAVLANIALRISLRVTDGGDSIAMLGSDAATRLAPERRGRALIADGSGELREVQLALAEPGDAMRWAMAGSPPSGAVWCDPLPERIAWPALLREAEAEAGRGIPFGRVDLPLEQRQPIARHDPAVDGHLLVLGAARSGRTTALCTLADGARAAGFDCVVISDDPAEAWSVLTGLVARPEAGRPGIVMIDDLDLLLGRLDSDTRYELLELLTRFVRGARGSALVISAQRLAGGLQTLAGLFDGRLLLRQSSRDEHVLAGGDGASFDPRLPPGAGRWAGPRGGSAVVQIALGAPVLPAPEHAELPVLRAQPGRPLAVVCPRPRELARRWQGTGTRVVLLGEEPTPDDGELRVSHGASSIVLLGDPDVWQSEWALLGMARRELSIAVVGCSATELRSVARSREFVPPLGGRPGECWWVEEGAVRRAVLDLPRRD
jgi:S-DNA-T family DNA segregation ATPase FtsK/SpoIIIE